MTEPSLPCRVVVAGGGITGLVTARRLSQHGFDVTLVEAGDRLGGQVRTVSLEGRLIDVGAEALHTGSPAVRDLVEELGLTQSIIGSRPGQSWLWTGRGLRPLPAGVGPTGPTKLRPVVRSGVMSVRGLGRAGLEPLAAKLHPALAAEEDVSVGDFVTTRFGTEVTERFVDPLLGSLHAGDVHRLSLRACAPALVDAATHRRSLVRHRPRVPSPAHDFPMFASWPSGLRTLTDALLQSVTVDVRLETRVTRLLPQVHGGYLVEVADRDGRSDLLPADGVVLALPASVTSAIVADQAPGAARTLSRADVARVATVVVGFDRAATQGLRAFAGTGLLLPSTSGSLLKAATNLSRKWPQFADDELCLVRLSAGRDGMDRLATLTDDELVAQLLDDLHEVTGVSAAPRLVHVQRWMDGLPQLRVDHRARLATVKAELARNLPGVVLAGSAYDGLGLVSCIASGEAAAAALTGLRPSTSDQHAQTPSQEVGA